ncbi:hypothetical protein M3689_07435 [Alkalihalophilus marmarensis]|jgi:hypothetical protein|uniref:Uncharacterized protein n=1 Tax=Alkalihalophilus marmarensis DSM 21297 TaxID=1188261 RepID=U6SQG0_9BACI|nr:hypothetical protein [Alkalihalophilus marmarensis]ERN52871.1 hypothetical protein A33I_14405 [Alkalihalophilus marmarensis DSM 21297]MCM3489125.1 hypothetical protein [Alkalihalophilus marmarensis]
MNKNIKNSPQNNLQKQQQIIHYKSEIKKLRSRLNKSESLIKTQQETIQSLMENVSRFERNSHNTVIEQPTGKNTGGNNLPVSIFMYTLIIPKTANEEEPIIIKGNLEIINSTATPLTSPVICIEFDDPLLTNLTARIQTDRPSMSDGMIQENSIEAWRFLEGTTFKDARKTGQYWLQPVEQHSIDINEHLSFSDFEIKIPFKSPLLNCKIQSYFYSEEYPKGVPSLNKISCAFI